MNTTENKYNLEERTSLFGEQIVLFCRNLKQNSISAPLINQIVRSGTSIGANYMEANGASSKMDFGNKIFICKKEIQETRYWLRMLEICYPDHLSDIKILANEAQELNLIFQKITTTLDKNIATNK